MGCSVVEPLLGALVLLYHAFGAVMAIDALRMLVRPARAAEEGFWEARRGGLIQISVAFLIFSPLLSSLLWP
jgi:hypothetical protein